MDELFSGLGLNQDLGLKFGSYSVNLLGKIMNVLFGKKIY